MPNQLIMRSDPLVAGWLILYCGLIMAMISLGGVTRLTGSGLSMVDWQPIKRILPPTTTEEWRHLFELYQQYPEYQKKNRLIDLPGFKSIFWLEYFHRLLGRLLGVVFLLPFLFFYWRRRIPWFLVPRFAGLFVLGGVQGGIGWYMVKSGLINEPHVSAYRLVLHLVVAIVILTLCWQLAFGFLFGHGKRLSRVSGEPDHAQDGNIGWLLAIALAVLLLQIMSGGLVAGLKAGQVSNTFPLMMGQLIPQSLWLLQPGYLNFFENPIMVHFFHRWLAVLLSLVLILLVSRLFLLSKILPSKGDHSRRYRASAQLIILLLLVQFLLGVFTVLYSVPIPLAALHQLGAVLLWSALTFVWFLYNRLPDLGAPQGLFDHGVGQPKNHRGG